MSGQRIRFTEPPTPALEEKPVPSNVLARWRSPYEEELPVNRPGVYMTQAAYHNINQHAALSDFEIGGMLVGQAYQSPDSGLFVVVEGVLEADHIDHSPVHLTFTSDALTDMLDRLEEMHPGRQIVGWYHTHPGLTIFLSSMDVWLHTHFFPQPWLVALVVDPHNNHGGFFTYNADEPGSLDQRNYGGFYEIGESGARSIVNWLNLKREKAEPSGAGLWTGAT
jgi:proteasome lid subunit RPN8/RPN11